VRAALIRLLLKWLGAPVPVVPDFYFYALVRPGQRIAEVTTNRNRARAIALELQALGEPISLWQCAPVKKVSLVR